LEIFGSLVTNGVFVIVFFLYGLALIIIGLLIRRNPQVVIIKNNHEEHNERLWHIFDKRSVV